VVGVDTNEVAIVGAEVEGIAEEGQAAVDRAAATGDVVGHRAAVIPERAPGVAIESRDDVWPLGAVEGAIQRERGDFPFRGSFARMIKSGWFEGGDVRGADLRKAGIAVTGVVAAAEEPVGRFACGLAEAPVVARDLGEGGAGADQS